MTPVRWWDYVFLIATVALTALWALLPGTLTANGCKVSTASLLGALAVGCPVCNKLIVALLGFSGALAIWAPLQPLVGAASVALILLAVIAKRRAFTQSCAGSGTAPMTSCGRSPVDGSPVAINDSDSRLLDPSALAVGSPMGEPVVAAHRPDTSRRLGESE
ncbi:MAG: hypothetical protein M3Z25_02140 [Actinomycetota bacterium]|nr:hypothetical protein [Actinomycetota bacterium]